MLHSPLLIPSGPDFWPSVAQALCDTRLLPGTTELDMSALRVVVPGFAHVAPLRTALAACKPSTFLPPRIGTLSSWLAMQPPAQTNATDSARMMTLYAELRQHGWLKKLFSARRNTDLLPLAQTLVALFDELSAALLPAMHSEAGSAEARWEAALAKLSPPARTLLSDEAQLVWTLWKSQLDGNDPNALLLAGMLNLAKSADGPLAWIDAHEPDAVQLAFLNAYGKAQPTLPVRPDWRRQAITPLYMAAWPEILDGVSDQENSGAIGVQPKLQPELWSERQFSDLDGVLLYPAGSLEQEAQAGAQTVLDWLAGGCTSVAIVAQDRVVARRMRALLERAQVFVADETGWKLSTTRSGAALAALLETIATRAESVALLDLLKSPFLIGQDPMRAGLVMHIEHALRRANIMGGWDASLGALKDMASAKSLLKTLADQAASFSGRRPLAQWSATTIRALEALGMRDLLQKDSAGQQVTALLDLLEQDGDALAHNFSFAEWRAFLSLQLECTPFVPPVGERRVVMLQLAGAPLRSFDAVLMVGADAEHLPSRPTETLFFANAVRHELGLATREVRQRTQLRNFVDMLCANPRVVLSWQAQRDGEPNAVSTWIRRLELARARAGMAPLPVHEVLHARRALRASPPVMPAPAAPQLLPRTLSASGYNSLVACPYQFFATRMLALDGLEELSDMPEKRDYGDWLHRVLRLYHETVRDMQTPAAEREALLFAISEKVFGESLAKGGAALGYYSRWQKIIPAYLSWASEREAQGWRFLFGEEWMQKPLDWSGGQITLRGCIDRIDENEDGERVILDYKTKSASALRAKLKEGEDHQLAFYGLLSDKPVVGAHFVALEASAGRTGDAAAADFAQWQVALRDQLSRNIEAIASGAPLPATGIQKTCVYCEVRGLCRKGAW